MSAGQNHRGLERLLATVLRYGTWLASAVIAIGLARAPIDAHVSASYLPAAMATQLVVVGIGLFILLPIVRVFLMAVVFAFRRDYLFVGIATLVLAIIGLGLALAAR